MLSEWPAVLESLRKRHRAGSLNFSRDSTLADFVASLSSSDRIQLLLSTCQAYRELEPPPAEFSSEHYVESSAHSIVISQILASRLDATEHDVCAILHASTHFCGHGSDVVAPIRLAEKVFANRPYSNALFDAAQAYRKALNGLTAIQAKLAKQELDWIMWHDSRLPEKTCWSRTLQLALPTLEPAEAFAWQWMLRHTTHALNHGRGKAWLIEAERRLDSVGAKRYHDRLDQWLVFPEAKPARLNPPGSNMLRLLVSYAVLAPSALPVLGRLKAVNWSGTDTARKVLKTLAWVEEQTNR